MKIVARFLLAFLFCALSPPQASAHENRPIFVKIEKLSAFNYRIELKVPNSIGARNQPTITLPSDCAPQTVTSQIEYHARCSEILEGREIRIQYPIVNPAVSTMVSFDVADRGAEGFGRMYPPDQSIIALEGQKARDAGIRFFDAGFWHITEGWDHLLFLTCLLALCSNLRMTLAMVTGFTVGHTFSLVISVLGVRVPPYPVEALIAFSIVGIAACCLKESRTSFQKYPVSASAFIGLLHGFGFAGYLLSLDLPTVSVLSAIVQFNLGVEAGQLVFVLALVLGWRCILSFRKWTKTDTNWETVVKGAVVFCCGSIGAYWFIERSSRIILGA